MDKSYVELWKKQRPVLNDNSNDKMLLPVAVGSITMPRSDLDVNAAGTFSSRIRKYK